MTDIRVPATQTPRPPRPDVPAFAEPLHVGRPNIGDRARLHARLDRMLDDRWLTNGGPLVEEFEARVAEAAGVRHAVAVCNATTGLQAVAAALGLTGEVIVPGFTFVATAHAFAWLGLTPVFCDVDPATHLLDVELVESLVTERTSAIVPVHLWGRPCDVAGVAAVAGRHGLAVVYDAAHAFGSATASAPVGSFGAAEVFSFHATKFINAFEGGAVVTDDDDLADRVRRNRNFGFVDYDAVAGAGTNAKMPEVAAAMGLTSLESRQRFVAANQANHHAYRKGCSGARGLRVLDHDWPGQSNHQYVVVEVDAEAGATRDELMALLHRHNVLARRYFFPGVHRMEPYASRPGGPPHLPVVERLAGSVLVLPTGTAVSPSDVATVCAILRNAVG